MKKLIYLFIIAILVSGCASASKNTKSEEQIIALQESLANKDQEIKRLQDSLQEKEILLREKDLKIGQLRDKLKNFGVFE